MKNYKIWLVVVALVIAGIILTRSYYLLGEIGIGWVFVLLLLSGAGLLFPLSSVKDAVIKWLFSSIVIGIVLAGGFFLWVSKPELTASQVRSLTDVALKDDAITAEYIGDHFWVVRMQRSGRLDAKAYYILYDERDGKFKGDTRR